MNLKKKYYVVWQGRKKGILDSWPVCKASVDGIKGARYKSFTTREQAERAFLEGPPHAGGTKTTSVTTQPVRHKLDAVKPHWDSLSVDAACSGNPGRMEYRGVDTKTKKELFRKGPFEEATNNIGEFLALVHGLALLKDKKDTRPIYSDSRTAMSWVRKKTVRTVLKKTSRNAMVFSLMTRAVKWLEENEFENKILKWETKIWGEIPADFGRK